MRLISYCPVCDSHENPIEARVIDETDQAHLLHIQCRQCRNSIVSLVYTQGAHMSSMGVLTDCTADDVERFKDTHSVVHDDVLTVDELLQSRGIAGLLDATIDVE